MEPKPLTLRVPVTPFYNRKFESLRLELGMNNQELLYYLIDNYTFDDSLTPLNIKTSISRRISKGINIQLITSLRVLHAYIGHILYRIDHI